MNLVFLGVIGIVFLTAGIWLRQDGFKAFFLVKGIPVLMPRAVQNMFIPIGITLIIWEIATSNLFPTTEMRANVFRYVGGPALIITWILGVWNPRWLRPRWLNYLEDEYGSIMWVLLDEARKDVPGWSQRVRTQAGLEEWAEETRERLGYPPHPGEIERRAKHKHKRRF
jgi:hypothetical protein